MVLATGDGRRFVAHGPSLPELRESQDVWLFDTGRLVVRDRMGSDANGPRLAFLDLVRRDARLELITEAKALLDMQAVIAAQQAAAAAAATSAAVAASSTASSS